MPISNQSYLEQADMAKLEKEGQAVTLWTVGMFCIFGWDSLLCLPKEIERVWRKQFTLISGLYVINKYYGLIHFALNIGWVMSVVNAGVDAETCKKIFRWQPVGALMLTFLTQVIMASRVYALYGKSKAILGVLATIMTAELAVHTYTLTIVFPAPSLPGAVVPCVAVGPLNWLIAFWAVPLVFDTTTFILTLVKTLMYWRKDVHTPLLTIFFRDGLMYFMVIFSMNLINVIIFATQDAALQSINLPATLMLNIIMSCRLVLNLRKTRPGHNMMGPFFLAKGGRKLPLWNGPIRSESDAYQLTSVIPTGATVQTGTDTEMWISNQH